MAEIEVSFDEGGYFLLAGTGASGAPSPPVTARARDRPVTPGEQRENSGGLGLAPDGVDPASAGDVTDIP